MEASTWPSSWYFAVGPPWEERQTKGARREEDVMPFMAALRSHVLASYLPRIGEPRLYGPRNIKILLPITPGMAWELRGVLTETIQEHNLLICGVQPRTTVEQSPQEAQVAQCMGRIMDACKNVIGSKALLGWTVELDWRAKEVKMMSAGSGGDHVMARVSQEGMPIFVPESITTVLGLDQRAFEREYVAARRGR